MSTSTPSKRGVSLHYIVVDTSDGYSVDRFVDDYESAARLLKELDPDDGLDYLLLTHDGSGYVGKARSASEV